MPVTILSRCQRFDLKRLGCRSADAALWQDRCTLERADADDEALRMIARAAEGSVRDGLSLLDQAIAYGDGKVKTEDVSPCWG